MTSRTSAHRPYMAGQGVSETLPAPFWRAVLVGRVLQRNTGAACRASCDARRISIEQRGCQEGAAYCRAQRPTTAPNFQLPNPNSQALRSNYPGPTYYFEAGGCFELLDRTLPPTLQWNSAVHGRTGSVRDSPCAFLAGGVGRACAPAEHRSGSPGCLAATRHRYIEQRVCQSESRFSLLNCEFQGHRE